MSSQFFRKALQFSGRARDCIDELNRVAADPSLGASPEQLEERYRILKLVDRPVKPLSKKDLVTRLITDNNVVWNELLRNKFCMEMKAADKDNKKVSDGFEWYMKQDFLYIFRLCSFEANRGLKAMNGKDFQLSRERVVKRANSAADLFKVCTDPKPDGLGIQDSVVLGTSASPVLDEYTKFLNDVAKKENWVKSLVAMIPCVQSYSMIAETLEMESVYNDTLWYNLWVKPNAQNESALKQIVFFMENYEFWEDEYDVVNKIFQEACRGEINFWAAAADQSSLNK